MMIRSTLSINMNVLFKIQEILGTPDRIYWTIFEIYSSAKHKVNNFCIKN